MRYSLLNVAFHVSALLSNRTERTTKSWRPSNSRCSRDTPTDSLSALLWSSNASAALDSVETLRPFRLSSRNTLLSRLPSMIDPSAVRLGAASTSSGSEMGKRSTPGFSCWMPWYAYSLPSVPGNTFSP
eukprot:GHRR01027007.1.p1 GENE.GHRR01027007.1~~GHRR01027007.1.p1  ORF type:complete len:129 (-),score=21.30 GHRR01027007.1:576-962(-)